MPRKLSYAEEAIADLAEIQRWQTQPGSGAASIRRLKLIRSAIQRLKRGPCLYPFGDYPGVREMPCQGHRVIYVATPDTGINKTAGDVLVLRVFGPGQDRQSD